MDRFLAIFFLPIFFLIALGAQKTYAVQEASPEITPENRMAIIRSIHSEYVISRQPLPLSEKDSEIVEIDASGRLNEDALRKLLAKRIVSVNAGDTAQITGIEFKDKAIVFAINGGGKKKKKWWERIQVGVGQVGTQPDDPSQPPPPGQQGPQTPVGAGTWIVIKFPKTVPDLTPEQVKELLSSVFDFARHSAAELWIEKLPEEFREAIKEKRAVVGMDREMVLAALGRPNQRIREMKSGVEEEDWLYGNPPFSTIVTFVEGKVIKVQEFK